jgi:N-acetyltransferase
MPLQMKPTCERCALPLGPTDAACICSYECTFCPACAGELAGVCPNCGGELLPRPRRRDDPSRPPASPVREDQHPAPCPARLEPVVLEGRFVRLEPLGRAHLADLTRAALSDPCLWDYMRVRVEDAATLERLVDDALAQQASGLTLPFAVVDRASGRAVGSTRYLAYRPVDRGVEIGWTWYARSLWSTAVNPEAKLLLLRHAFEVLGCMRVEFQTDVRNLRSRAAILRLGARPEGVYRKYAVVRGRTIRDSVYFSILDDEWPTVEAGLRARLAAFDPGSRA